MAVITRNNRKSRISFLESFDLSKCSNYSIIIALVILLIVVIDTPSLIKTNNQQPKKSDDAAPGKTKEITTTDSSRSSNENLIPSYDFSAEYDPKLGKEFTDKYCIFNNNTSWYPSSKDDEWQLRAPYFMVPGVKKSGTTSISKYISEHPLVGKTTRTKELQFFLNKNVQDFLVKDDDGNEKILVQEARHAIYSQDYKVMLLRNSPNRISFDGTPGYIFFSAIMPQRIFCVMPWIKFVIIMRNPVDRVYSNWAYALRVAKKTSSQTPAKFNAQVKMDFALLEESGFLNATSEEEESLYWKKFLELKLERRREAIVGRSLYEIQIRQWFQALRDIGRNPSTEVYLVFSEDLHKDKQGEMNQVYKFLGLPPFTLEDEKEEVTSTYLQPMETSTRKTLEDFFEPYNQKLFTLLKENGFDVREDIWKRQT